MPKANALYSFLIIVLFLLEKKYSAFALALLHRLFHFAQKPVTLGGTFFD
ncbi:MAG: hypothetical protein LBO00_02935 [Zoogloeaceae bacterium]|nr:hypothetical protein [Zoogloeaceae bacterium]